VDYDRYIFVAIFLIITSLSYVDELTDLLVNLYMQIGNDKQSFQADLSATFGIDETKVNTIIGKVDKPADAYMILRLSEITKKQPDEVLLVYKMHKNKGWGVVAQELGIKPGSKEFHELKENKLKKHGKNEHNNEKHDKHEKKEHGKKGKGKDRD